MISVFLDSSKHNFLRLSSLTMIFCCVLSVFEKDLKMRFATQQEILTHALDGQAKMQGQAGRSEAVNSSMSWMQVRLKSGISRDACCQKRSSYLKLHQVHQVDLWRWKPPIIKGVVSSFDIDEWMKLEMNETHLFTHTLQASWAKCEQSEKLARKEILQKLNVTMQKRVSKAESSKAKIYNARCKNSKTSWNWEFVSIQRIQRILMPYVICVACVAVLLHQLPSGYVRLWARRVPVWMMPRAKLPRQHVPWQKRCEKMFGVRSTEESLTHMKTWRLDEFLSCRTFGQRSSRKCYEGIQCTRPCRCDRHLTARNSIMTCISMY